VFIGVISIVQAQHIVMVVFVVGGGDSCGYCRGNDNDRDGDDGDDDDDNDGSGCGSGGSGDDNDDDDDDDDDDDSDNGGHDVNDSHDNTADDDGIYHNDNDNCGAAGGSNASVTMTSVLGIVSLYKDATVRSASYVQSLPFNVLYRRFEHFIFHRPHLHQSARSHSARHTSL